MDDKMCLDVTYIFLALFIIIIIIIHNGSLQKPMAVQKERNSELSIVYKMYKGRLGILH